MEKYIKIDGVVTTDIEEAEFMDEFLTFIENKGWSFGGTVHNYIFKEEDEE